MTEERPPLGGRYALQRSLQSAAGLPRFFALNVSSGKRVVVALVDAAHKGALEPAVDVKHVYLAGLVDMLSVEPGELPEGTTLPAGAVAFVAEHIPGRSLRAVLEAGKMHPAKAVAWTLRLCEALQALHTAGAVHGAISPRSVIAEPPKRAIAPVLSQLVAPPLAAFSAPERLKGAGESVADDVWALYATLYAALTGVAPHEGATREALLKAVLSKPKPLDAFGVDEPVLQEILGRGLLSDRNARNSDLGELIEALDSWERDPTKQPPKRPAAPRPGLRGLGDIVGGALGAVREDGLVADDAALPDDQGTDLPEASSPQAVVVPLARGERASSSGQMPVAAPAEEGQSEGTLPAAPAVEAGPASTAEPKPPTPSVVQKRRVSVNPFEKKRAFWPLLIAAALAGGAGVYLAVAPGPQPPAKTAAVAPPAAPQPKPATSADLKPRKSPREQRDSCVAAHFPADSLPAGTSFEFVCAEGDFLSTSRRLHDMVKLPEPASDAGLEAGTAAPADTGPAKRERDKKPPIVGLGLDWYELPATAIIRRTCCPGSAPVMIPETTGWCEQLQSIVQRMAEDSQRAVDLSPGARSFDKAVKCLFANKIEHPFSYKMMPTPENRDAFQQFLSRSAIIDAQH